MGSNFEARFLICTECKEEFVFTVEAQEYFAERGYVEDPLMCKHCYTRSKRDKRAGGAGAPPRAEKPESVNRDIGG
ncbi:MAG: zinc-ribbon domain containing protein [Candidatus Zixiibacteriota bacterium]